MRLDPRDYHAVACRGPGRRRRRSGRLAADRIQGARGLSGLAVDRPSRRAVVARCTVGRVLRRRAALPRPEPRHLRLDHAGRGRRRRAVGRAASARRGATVRSRPRGRRSSCVPHLRQVADVCARRPGGGAAAAPPARGAPRPRHRAGATEYDVVVVGAGPAGLAAAVYGASEGLQHARDRARGARRPGRHVVQDRELPRVPGRRVGRRAGRTARSGRRRGSAPRSS